MSNIESFATLDEFVELAKKYSEDSNKFKLINPKKYNMSCCKLQINGVCGIAFAIKEYNRITLTHVEKYSIDRASKKCFSFYRDKNGITNSSLARRVEKERSKYPEGLDEELKLTEDKVYVKILSERDKTLRKKAGKKSKYRLRKGVRIPFRLEPIFFRKMRNGSYANALVIYDKNTNNFINIDESVSDFIIKNRKRVFCIRITPSLATSYLADVSYLTDKDKPTTYKEIRISKIDNNLENSNLKEQEDYLNYLSSINKDYLYSDENIEYYIKEARITLNKCKKMLETNNTGRITEAKKLLSKQLVSLKYLFENRINQIIDPDIRNDIEVDFHKLAYMNGELINPNSKENSDYMKLM